MNLTCRAGVCAVTAASTKIDLHLPSGEAALGEADDEDTDKSPWSVLRPGRFGLQSYVDYGVDSSEENDVTATLDDSDDDEAVEPQLAMPAPKQSVESTDDCDDDATLFSNKLHGGVGMWRRRATKPCSRGHDEMNESHTVVWRRAIGALAPETFAGYSF